MSDDTRLRQARELLAVLTPLLWGGVRAGPNAGNPEALAAIRTFLTEERRKSLLDAEAACRDVEVGYGNQAEGQNEPEFSMALKGEEAAYRCRVRVFALTEKL